MSQLLNTKLFADANLVSYWPFEGNSNDSKGSNNGTSTNITFSTTSAAYKQRAGFNGTTSYVTIPRSVTLEAVNFSVAGWIFNTQAVQTSGGAGVEIENILTKEGANTGYAMLLASTGFGAAVTNGLVAFSGNGASLDSVNSPAAIPTNRLTHVAFTHSDASSRNRLYINGALVRQAAAGNISQATGQALILGAFTDTASRFYYGNEDDLTYFSKELTLAEIQILSGSTEGFFLI